MGCSCIYVVSVTHLNLHIMKSRIVKCLMALLGFGGLTTACLTAEYGCPHADYKVYVTAYNRDGSKAIMGLKVSVVENGTDTVALGMTNRHGECSLIYSWTGWAEMKDIKIGVDDIDGTAHEGEFASEVREHTILPEDYKGDDGDWYAGSAYVAYEFFLEEKEK